jgi:hypothetical protein
MPSNEQIVRSRYPKHLDPNQNGRYDDRVHAVHSNAVHALKPRQSLAVFTHKTRIRSQIRHGPARFHSANYILLRQILVFN